MSIVSRLKKAFTKIRSTYFVGEGAWIRDGNRRIDADKALSITAVYACVKVLSETIGSLPCILYRRLPGGGKERAVDHPFYTMLHDRPNAFQTAMEYFEMVTSHLALKGNSYSLILIGRGRVDLIPLNPSYVNPVWTPDFRDIYYEFAEPGKPVRKFSREDILHIRGQSIDGLKGLSPVDLAALQLNEGYVLQEHSNSYFSNAGRPNGMFKLPGVLPEPASERLRKQLDERMSPSGSGRPLLLEAGLDFTPIVLNNDQAEFIENRKFSKADLASWWRMPPHKIGIMDNATFSNIEHQSLEFTTDCIRPPAKRIEQALMFSLFTEKEAKTYTIEFLFDDILRADIKTRTEAQEKAAMNGFLNIDEIRAMENRNPLPDGLGQKHYRPLNLIEVGKEPEEPTEKKPKKEEKPAKKRDFSPFYPLIEETTKRFVARKMRGKEKSEAFEKALREQFQPIFRAVFDVFDVKSDGVDSTNLWVSRFDIDFNDGRHEADYTSILMREFKTIIQDRFYEERNEILPV